MFHHFDGAVVVTGLDVQLRSFCRAPTAAVGRGGCLQFAYGKVDQAAIAQQLRFLHMQFIGWRL